MISAGHDFSRASERPRPLVDPLGKKVEICVARIGGSTIRA
jgi:hypothetical protein